MLYLDYILYIIIIILLYFFVNKIIKMNEGDTKEGFDHRGKAKISVNQGKPSQMEYAEYIYFDKETFSTKVMDAKPILDKLIALKTDSIIVGPKAFGLNENDHSQEYDYLVIKFKNPYTIVSDGTSETNDGVWWWSKGDSVSLKFGKGSPDPYWLTVLEALYKIADLIAILLLQTPFVAIQAVAVGKLFGFSFPGMFRAIFDVIKNFVKALVDIAKGVFKQIWKNIIKVCIKKFMYILKHFPKFLKGIFDWILKFIETVVKKTFKLLSRLWKTIVKILKTLINLPLIIFDIIDKVVDIVLNLFLILINLPIAILNMIVAFQQIGIDTMNKTPTIPFLNMFFK